jgi:integrase
MIPMVGNLYVLDDGERQGPSPALLYLARLSPGSRRAQAQALRVLAGMLAPGIAVPVEAFPWHAVMPEQAVALRARLAQDYAPATARRILAALRGVVEEAWRLGQLDGERKARLLDLPPVRGSRPPAGKALTPDEIGALYSAAESARDRALLGVLLQGGLRRAEVAHLTWQDVRHLPDRGGWQGGPPARAPERGPGQRASQGTPLAITVQGKGHKVRVVHLAGRAVRYLAEYMDEYRQAGVRAGVPDYPPPDRALFGLRSGAAVAKVLARLCARAGVRCSPHDLRRTYASFALGAGVDIATVQAAMGHADPRTTARYDRRGEDAQRSAAETIARIGG